MLENFSFFYCSCAAKLVAAILDVVKEAMIKTWTGRDCDIQK